MRSDTRAPVPRPYGASSRWGPNVPERPGEEGSLTPCEASHGVCVFVIYEVYARAQVLPEDVKPKP